MLPYYALKLISEYSKPLTRPDWRTYKRSISWNIYMNEIDALYDFDNTNCLFKLVHTNMHVRIDLCLCDMTQEELDVFINYRACTNKVIIHKYKYMYKIIMYIGTSFLLGYTGFKLADVGYYFRDNRVTNNLFLDKFIYSNIVFGTFYSACHIGSKVLYSIYSF